MQKENQRLKLWRKTYLRILKMDLGRSFCQSDLESYALWNRRKGDQPVCTSHVLLAKREIVHGVLL
jgi:hypothetical protein